MLNKEVFRSLDQTKDWPKSSCRKNLLEINIIIKVIVYVCIFVSNSLIVTLLVGYI